MFHRASPRSPTPRGSKKSMTLKTAFDTTRSDPGRLVPPRHHLHLKSTRAQRHEDSSQGAHTSPVLILLMRYARRGVARETEGAAW